MEFGVRIAKLRDGLLQKIAGAARNGDPRTVNALNEKLQRAERLDAQFQVFERELDGLENGYSDVAVQQRTPAPNSPDLSEGIPARSSGRARGVKAREEFVASLPAGMGPIGPVTGAVFGSPKGPIGVAYARERKRPNRWFLGLPENEFEHAVLLCEDRNKKVTHFSLPREFLDDVASALSRKDNQVKFNVLKKGGQYYLLVKPARHISLERFRDNFHGLKAGSSESIDRSRVGIQAYIVECLQTASKSKPVTKRQILDGLIKKFPNRDPDKMKNTLTVLVPSWLRAHKDLDIQTDEKRPRGYWLP